MSESEKEPERLVKRDNDLRSFLRRYGKFWYLFVISLVLAFTVAHYVNWYSTPIYGVVSKLMLRDQDDGTQQLLKDLDINKTDRNIQNEIEILHSYDLIGKALNHLDFDVSYFLVGDVKVSEVYKDCPFKVTDQRTDFAAYFARVDVLLKDSVQYTLEYHDARDGDKTITGYFGKQIHTPGGDFTLKFRDDFNPALLYDTEFSKRHYRIKFNTESSLENHYRQALQVQLAREESTILELYLEDPVPQKGVDFLNTLVSVYLRNDVEEQNKSTSATQAFIEKQLGDITRNLNKIEQERENFKVSKGIVDLESESKMVLEGIKGTDDALSELNAKLSFVDYLEKYVKDNKSVSDLSPSAMDINDPLLIKLVNKLSELQAERERILKTSTANYPELVPVNAEISLTRQSLLENIKGIRNGMEQTRDEYLKQEQRYKGKIQQIPSTERSLLQIERQFSIRENLYTFLLEKKAELSISLASSQSDKRVVDYARVLPGPVRPNPKRAYSIALLLGLLLPAGGLYLREKLNNKIVDKTTVEQLTRLPIAGVVGISDLANRWAVREATSSPIAEAYRGIRANLRFFSPAEKPVILITSSVSTEGKTFTAMNLATIYALSGKKAVLVGLDLRKPGLDQDSGVSSENGVSGYLSGHLSLNDIIQKDIQQENLDIVVSGSLPPNPGELIASPLLPKLIDELRELYDVVILDTPPVGLVADALTIAEFADITLLVVRQNTTKREDCQYLFNLNREGKLPNSAVIFNAVKSRRGSYNYYGGYGYGYGQGYGEKSSAGKSGKKE